MDDLATASQSQIVLKKGSKQRLMPWATKHVGGLPNAADLVVVLRRSGMDDAGAIMARWPAEHVAAKPNDWSDEVLDMVRERTDLAGCRCEYVVQALDASGEVQREYGMVAQPITENLSPTPEGVLHLAMRNSSALVGTMLSDRAAVVESYQGLILQMRSELDRAYLTITRYQTREEEYHRRELELVDRERALRLAEVEGAADSRERTEDRYDRVLEKAGDVVEAGVVEAVAKLVEGVDPKDIPALIRELGPLAAKFMGGAN